jgi:endonuclease YncB( thermonuclease family)
VIPGGLPPLSQLSTTATRPGERPFGVHGEPTHDHEHDHEKLPAGHPPVGGAEAPAAATPEVEYDPTQNISGTIDLPAANQDKVRPGEVIFVSVRGAADASGAPGPLLAVDKLVIGKFPQAFEIDGRKAMMPGTKFAGKVSVIDGDGLEIGGVKIRLFGVDAPEVDQYCGRDDGTRWRCGQYATVALDRLVGGKSVTCTVHQMDRYGRPVAACSLEGRDVAGELAREGWVLAYRKYSADYADEEEVAKKARSGVWAGRVEPPWQYRERIRNRHDRP